MGRTEASRKPRQAWDFRAIDEAFFLSSLVIPAKGERFQAIGHLDGVISVIFATLGTEGLSIISARPASLKERKLLS